MTNGFWRSLPLLLLLGAALTVGACATADVVAHGQDRSDDGGDFAVFFPTSKPNSEIQAP
jgi:hypothetical protein